MDWCVDPAVKGALGLAEREVLAHLSRHAAHPELVPQAGPMVQGFLARSEGTGTRWVSLDWQDRSARLTVRRLPRGDWPAPGPSGPGLEPVEPGLARASRARRDLERRAEPHGLTITLSVTQRANREGGGAPPDGARSGDGLSGRADAGNFLITLTLRLPRDRLSVPVVRHLTHASLEEVGVVDEVAWDVELALAEAGANVLEHSGPGDVYDVSITIGPSDCEIRVTDVGHGFDYASLGAEMAGADAESGRGLALMRALMDQVRFESAPERGTIVHLVKRLQFDDTRPARRLRR